MTQIDNFPGGMGDISEFNYLAYHGLPPYPSHFIINRPIPIYGDRASLKNKWISYIDGAEVGCEIDEDDRGYDFGYAFQINDLRTLLENSGIQISPGGKYPHLRTHGHYEWPITDMPTLWEASWWNDENKYYTYIIPDSILPDEDWSTGSITGGERNKKRLLEKVDWKYAKDIYDLRMAQQVGNYHFVCNVYYEYIPLFSRVNDEWIDNTYFEVYTQKPFLSGFLLNGEWIQNYENINYRTTNFWEPHIWLFSESWTLGVAGGMGEPQFSKSQENFYSPGQTKYEHLIGYDNGPWDKLQEELYSQWDCVWEPWNPESNPECSMVIAYQWHHYTYSVRLAFKGKNAIRRHFLHTRGVIELKDFSSKLFIVEYTIPSSNSNLTDKKKIKEWQLDYLPLNMPLYIDGVPTELYTNIEERGFFWEQGRKTDFIQNITKYCDEKSTACLYDNLLIGLISPIQPGQAIYIWDDINQRNVIHFSSYLNKEPQLTISEEILPFDVGYWRTVYGPASQWDVSVVAGWNGRQPRIEEPPPPKLFPLKLIQIEEEYILDGIVKRTIVGSRIVKFDPRGPNSNLMINAPHELGRSTVPDFLFDPPVGQNYTIRKWATPYENGSESEWSSPGNPSGYFFTHSVKQTYQHWGWGDDWYYD
jgi:hypothetical protein